MSSIASLRPVHTITTPSKSWARLQSNFGSIQFETDRRNLLLSPRTHTDQTTIVYNEVGIQMLNRHLHRQIFKNPPLLRPDPRAVTISREHLRKHGLDITKSSQIPNLGFDLPLLQGYTIDEHFHTLGSRVAEPWLSFCNDFVNCDLPPKPMHWVVRSGWTRYPTAGEPHSVPFPNLSERTLVFDVETLPKFTENPIIAVAASTEAWYAWLSPWIIGETDDREHLVPLGPPSTSRIVVGHNVSFDRARVREEYSLRQTRTRFIDTMALHIAVNGMTAGQRPAWNKFQKESETKILARSETIAKQEEDPGTDFPFSIPAS
jgi:DNA polymerase gamma 1